MSTETGILAFSASRIAPTCSSLAACLAFITVAVLGAPQASAREVRFSIFGRDHSRTNAIVKETAELGARNAELRTEISLKSRLLAARRTNKKLMHELAHLNASDAQKLLLRVDAVNRDLGYLSRLSRSNRRAGLGGTLRVFERGSELFPHQAQAGEIRFQQIERVTQRINAVHDGFARLVSEQPDLLTTPVGGKLRDRLRQAAGYAREVHLEPKPDNVARRPRLWTRRAVDNFNTATGWLGVYLEPDAALQPRKGARP
jgi:hypothetical protein